MARLIPAEERIRRARQLIRQARDLPVPVGGRFDLSYIAGVKDLLRQAKDMVKMIPYTPTATREMKADIKVIYDDIERAGKEILR
ncbi:MAG: hypothetical protein JXA13_00390 [Anaerolineales bacterium]|nr:hypothetical protein [Anaerolineales bacterium]